LVEGLAVLATFDPEKTVPADQRDAVEALSDNLSEHDGRQQWMLKESARVEALSRVLRKGGLAEAGAVRARATVSTDTPLQRVLDLILLGEPVNLEDLDENELLAALHVGRWCASAGSLADMPQLGRELDREVIEGRLALIETLRPIRDITADGCVGRELELGRLHAYLEGPPHQNLARRPPLLVYGIGGVGKSTLIAQFLLNLASRPDPVAWAYLDLDRPTLASYDPLVLLIDLIRQVGAQFPTVRRFLDFSGVDAEEAALGSGLDEADSESWRDLAPRVAGAVNDACGGRLVVILDTYEELQRAELSGRTIRASESLYSMLATLSDYTDRFRLVVSGRAPAHTFVASGPLAAEQLLNVAAFEDGAATTVLQHLYEKELGRLPADDGPADGRLDPTLADEVVASVGGAPLTLRLAARVLALEGKAGLEDADARATVVGRVTDEFVTGFLYHRILRHIRAANVDDREALREVATASLALRIVTAELLREVVFPVIGRSDLDARTMLSGLLAETALADNHEGAARLREELRGPALLALRYKNPDLVDSVHRRAAAYYRSHNELAGSSVELAYHRLAIGDAEALEGLESAAIVSLERSSADLPPTTRGMVRSGVASPEVLDDQLRRKAAEREIDREARRALEAGDLEAAALALKGESTWLPTTRLHRLSSLLAEARGDLPSAIAAARRDAAAALVAEDPPDYGAAVIRFALLSERAHDSASATAALADADGQPWLAGHVLVRLEIQLNRFVILERTGALDPDPWVLDLDIRALLVRADLNAVRANTGLVRLLAATLGRDELSWVLEATRFVGLGTTTASSLLRNLATALGQWDMARGEPGKVTRSVGLMVREPVSTIVLGDAWFQAVVGQSTDIAPLLDRAFSLEPPDAAVQSALRMIYLWWGSDPQERIEEEFIGESPPEHFLDRLPLHYADSKMRRLLRALTGAYPSPEDRLVLASEVGLELGNVNVKTTGGESSRSLLDEAAKSGRIPSLIGQVLSDSKTEAFHDELRGLIGPEWLAKNRIDS
jgi:hypothetical protein